MRQRAFLAAAALALLLAGGCGRTGTVSGVVTVGGAPAKGGGVTFHPAGGGGTTAVGTIGPDGRFTLAVGTESGLAPGEYKVTVVGYGDAPPWVNKSEAPPAPPRVTAARFADPATTPLTRTVKPGPNEFELDVEPAAKK